MIWAYKYPPRENRSGEFGIGAQPKPIKVNEVNLNQDEYKWYKIPSNVSSECVSFVNDEKGVDDDIFQDSISLAHDERSYPTRKQYVYSTLPHNIYVMYPNNIIMPVKQCPELATRFYGKFDRTTETISAHGVYVVDYISLREIKFNNMTLEMILTFYKNSNIVASDNKDISNTLLEYITRHRDSKSYLRIITFVPEYNFRHHNVVFVPNTGLCIGTGEMMHNYLHPNSREAFHLAKKETIEANNFVSIDIVDNTTKNDYFVKVGTKIYKLEPERDKSKQEGVGYTMFKNNTIMDTTFVNLEDAKKELGVFNSKKECDNYGNTGRIIENESRRLDIEDKRLDLEESKMMNELQKANNERVKELMKHEHYKEKHNLEMDKLHLEIDKAKLDRKLYLEKLNLDLKLTKLEREEKYTKIITDMLKCAIDIKKAQYDIYKSELEFESDIYKQEFNERKMRYEEIMHGQKVALDGIGGLTKIINLIGQYL